MRRTLTGLVLVLLYGLPAPRPVGAGSLPAPDFKPDPKSVQRYGPAYRYPQAGWVVLHIEGKPYARGYQHGRLMAPEIAAHVRCFAAVQSPEAPDDGWKLTRMLSNALFVRRYEKEYLEEMKGIAAGASDAGARFDGRRLDLVDIVALNAWPEIDTLDAALDATATGLEGKRFEREPAKAKARPKPLRCSAFAATGPATADGKVVFGHITMFSLYPSLFYNVWLDVKPDKGHRVLMQTYPGGIQSGLDYYLNSAGILVCETTIAQTKFDIKGLCVASRIRQALQYADTIDKAVEILKKENNGLYTNEWLLADVKTNEIAMFELGTHKSKLYRSSKGEWFGGTEGFYWGCNNTKDLQVRLETVPDVKGRPANVVFRPSDRDKVWLKLYGKYKGKIDANFGKIAFTTPPIAAYPSLDAKFTTTDMAKELKTWALFGPPLGRTWRPTREERRLYPEVRPMVSNPWTALHTTPPAKVEVSGPAVADLKSSLSGRSARTKRARRKREVEGEAAWHGTLLPKTDADTWLAAAFADYEKIYALEKALKKQAGKEGLDEEDRDRLAVFLYQYRSMYLAAARATEDVPLAKTRSDLTRDEWYRMAVGKGVLVLHELRKTLGDKAFEEAMRSFGKEHAGKAVTTAQFQEHIEKASGKDLGKFFAVWVGDTGLPRLAPGNGKAVSKKQTGVRRAVRDRAWDPAKVNGVFTTLSFYQELENTLIVYGTADEVPTNREAAQAVQNAIIRRHANYTVPIKSDKEVTEKDLKNHHLLLIGRPNSNTIVQRCRKSLPVTFGSRSFVVRNKSYAHALSAVTVAAENPWNKRYSVVVVAGLSAEATLRAAPRFVRTEKPAGEVLLLAHGKASRALVLPTRELVREVKARK
jgi:hypothetical protein